MKLEFELEVPDDAVSRALRQAETVGRHLATYPANLCPLLFGSEFAKLGCDFGKAVGHSIEYKQRIAAGVGVCAPKHLQDMLSDLECMKSAGEIGG
ncbi:MAG: hypothetical protein NTW28_12360 [Candidatus Solibacter sp.]|nr:hypothetical protein [Candidatus Solibacter sp.]